ncbi:hypothetical protein C0991_005687 [Blastosporella zonata]|nr:hypothetical protein C0991_005687 [Blastosporella zonata]
MDYFKALSINDTNSTPASTHTSTTPAHDQAQGLGHALLKNLGDALNNHHASTPSPAPVEPGNGHILNKVSDALGGGHHSQSTTPSASTQPKEEHLLGKLSSALSGSHSTSTPVSAPKKEEHVLNKISSALGKSTPPPAPAPKHDGLLGKLEGVIGHVTKDEQPAKPETFGDKINNVLGGGSKGEAKEDGLDKAIDFVQEHVLKEGQQKNETVIEQLKDKQIADAIRRGVKSVTGKDIP